MNIPEHILNIMTNLESAGFEVYAVGGCVRDSLMGRIPSDWDLTTSALPEDIINIFSGYPLLTNGIKHGTVTVLWNKIPVEITTYRIDGNYTDNRRPESITFSSTITEDLMRRDFTVNAIAYNPKSGFCDPRSGRDDIKAKILRAVGDPEKRFREDALRIMRCIRFSAVLEFNIDEPTSESMFMCKELLKNIAKERITEEFSKLLTAPHPAEVLERYFHITSEIFFGKTDLQGITIPRGIFDVINKVSQSLTSRLALFLLQSAECFNHAPLILAETFFSGMKFSKQIRHQTLDILRLLNAELPSSRIGLRKLLTDTNSSILAEALNIRKIIYPQNPNTTALIATLDEILKADDCCRIADLNINGNDLTQNLNIRGAEIGIVLKRMLNAVIEDKCPNEKTKLLEMFEKNLI